MENVTVVTTRPLLMMAAPDGMPSGKEIPAGREFTISRDAAARMEACGEVRILIAPGSVMAVGEVPAAQPIADAPKSVKPSVSKK